MTTGRRARWSPMYVETSRRTTWSRCDWSRRSQSGAWAIATLFDLGSIGARVLDVVFVLCGLAVMAQFIRAAHRIEPFTARD